VRKSNHWWRRRRWPPSWAPRVSAVAALMALLSSGAALAVDRAHTLNIYAWPDYFPRALIDKFQTETGIHVNYAVMDSPEMAETLLSVGHSNYDLVTMNASPQLAREIPKGFWKKLDRTKIPNARNADLKIMNLLQAADPGNQYALPWMWGTAGILYNRDKILKLVPNAPLDSLDMILRKDLASKFAACGISILDSWGDILPMVAHYLGQPRLSTDPKALAAVVAKLQEIKPYISRIASSGYYQQMAGGDLCLAIGYSGDAMIAKRMIKEGNSQIHVDYSFARENVPFYIDTLAVPADSPNPAAAELFIDFFMRPEVSAAVTRFIGFATGNAAAVALLEPAVRDNAVIYPPTSVRDRMALQPVYSAEDMRIFTRAWQQVKSGN